MRRFRSVRKDLGDSEAQQPKICSDWTSGSLGAITRLSVRYPFYLFGLWAFLYMKKKDPSFLPRGTGINIRQRIPLQVFCEGDGLGRALSQKPQA